MRRLYTICFIVAIIAGATIVGLFFTWAAPPESDPVAELISAREREGTPERDPVEEYLVRKRALDAEQLSQDRREMLSLGMVVPVFVVVFLLGVLGVRVILRNASQWHTGQVVMVAGINLALAAALWSATSASRVFGDYFEMVITIPFGILCGALAITVLNAWMVLWKWFGLKRGPSRGA